MENNKQNQTEVKNFYGGIFFDRCQLTDVTFQTLVQGDMRMHGQAEAGKDDDEEAAAWAEAEAGVVTEEAEATASAPLPEALRTPLAEALLARLVGAGLLDEGWQPVSLTGAEKGVLASLLAGRLDIATPWQTFGRLWGVKPETLRSACNKGMEQRRTGEFMRRVVGVMEGKTAGGNA